MSIPFTCPHCGKQTEVADEYAGRSGPCAACGQLITVPGPGGTKKAPSPWAAPVEPRYEARGTGSALGTGGVVVGAIVGGFVVLVVCGGILAALLLPAVQSAREAARRSQCMNNLKQIALAFHNYHDVFGTLPPAYVADSDGKPMHSWRVLLLPFLEQRALYDAYNFDEPWDSPANRMVVETMIPVYGCPSDPAAVTATTNYMVITGPGTVFEGAEATSFRQILDGTSNTLLVVEVRDTGVSWAAPIDLDAADIEPPFAGGLRSPGSRHAGGINAALCDGSVRFLSQSISRDTLRAMITKAGGERVRDF
jgi:prepilin-type processing-associated H-X9-DG protein